MQENTITLRHQGLSQGEVETLFNILSDPFEVSEEEIEETSEHYVSMVSVELPLAYGRNSFKQLGLDRWERVKEVLKNLKWRRGRRAVQFSLRFSSHLMVAFSVNTRDDRTFGRALETIEYLMDVILFQLEPKRLPPDVTEVIYTFGGEEFRWYPARAVGRESTYLHIRGEWVREE